MIVKNALRLFSQDQTGLADYALESGGQFVCVCSAVVSHYSGDCNDGDNSCICPAGGSIVSTRCSESYQTKAALLSLFGIPLWYFSQSPRTVIQVGFHLFFLNPT